MKRFTIPCDFGDKKHPFHVYVGKPIKTQHPLKYQAAWLQAQRGGYIPQDVMDSFEKLQKIALENNVSYEDLCVYALRNAATKKEQVAKEQAQKEINKKKNDTNKELSSLDATEGNDTDNA